jgi:hypothetical protein
MAKVNKSFEIREYRRLHRRAKPNTIVEALAKRGIKVTRQQVSTTLYMARRRRTTGRRARAAAEDGVVRRRRRRRPGRRPGMRRGRRPGRRPAGLSAELLLAAKDLIDQVGGVDQARAALDLLEKLQ